VLFVSWLALRRSESVGFFYAFVNYAVHGVMYTYYATATWSTRVRRLAWTVTLLQIAQMILCATLTFAKLVVMLGGTRQVCQGDTSTLALVLILYVSYGFLFARIYMQRFGRAKLE
jgi:hypothetical protein